MRIPEVSQWTRYDGEEMYYMGFGDDKESLMIDEIQAEGSTWLVREKGSKKREIIFASSGEGSDGVSPAESIAEYIREAMKNGFVYYWPKCFTSSPYVSYAAQEASIKRFQAGPVTPNKIEVGSRVHFVYFSEGGRGEVLEIRKTKPKRDFAGDEFAKVQLDEGTLASQTFVALQ